MLILRYAQCVRYVTCNLHVTAYCMRVNCLSIRGYNVVLG